MDRLSVVVPFYNGHEHIERLLRTLPTDLPVIVVDDRSDPPLSAHALLDGGQQRNQIRVIRLENKGYFAGAVNAGVAAAPQGHDVLVLNQDTWFEGTAWLDLLTEKRRDYGMIGERIRGAHPAFPHGYIHGTLMFLRRDALDAVGLLDAQWYPLWGCTAEWQLRAARQGFRILPLETIPGFHHARPPDQHFGSSIQALLQRQPDLRPKLIRTPPLVSVVVACHNYGRYLADCLHSLIGGPTCLGYHPGQSLQSFEVIIVDDASTDDSVEIAQSLADPWKGIRFVRHLVNRGTAATLNTGIEMAAGQYITFLSADDMREPESLERLVRCAESHSHSFCYDDIRFFGGGRRLDTWRMGWKHSDFDFDALLQLNTIHAGILYPKRAWQAVGGYPEIMGDGREDWAFNIALGRVGWCGVRVPHAGYLYRNEGQGRHRRQSQGDKTRFFEKIRGLYPELYRGERPMGCCGGRKGANAPAAQNQQGATMMAMQSLPGAEGMVQIEYLGEQMPAIWTGPVTHVQYRFGKTRRVGWIDRRDLGERGVSGFLNMKLPNDTWAFRLYQPPPVVVEPATDNASVDAQPAVVEPSSDNTSLDTPPEDHAPSADQPATGGPAPDPAQLTVDQVKALRLNADQWQALLELERAGKHRKSLIEWIEQTLADD
jgi:GT2 family glycosyltransferase